MSEHPVHIVSVTVSTTLSAENLTQGAAVDMVAERLPDRIEWGPDWSKLPFQIDGPISVRTTTEERLPRP